MVTVPTKMIPAVNNNDWSVVRKCIENMALKDSVEYTQLQQIPIHNNIIIEACSRGFAELMSVFLNNGFPVDCEVDESNETILHLAASKGHLSVVKLLLNFGANKNRTSNYGETPLFKAVRQGHLNVAKYLLTVGTDTNTRSKNGNRLLCEAICSKNVTREMVQLLLDSGCYPNDQGDCYFSLCSALQNNNVVAEVLLYVGVCVDGVATINIPLLLAVLLGNIPIMQLLLEYGADINARGPDGYTALHEAVRGEELQSVEFLIENGSLIDSVNYYNETPLLLSINYKYFNIAMLLINNGADLNLGIYDTVLHRAIKHTAHVEVIECLLEHGASVTTIYIKKTAIQYVHYSNYSKDEKLHIAKLLLIYGSDHYVKDYFGDTLLHWACEIGDVKLVEYLIEYGLNVDVKNRFGMKPYDIAREKGHTKIMKAIIHHHCNKCTSFN